MSGDNAEIVIGSRRYSRFKSYKIEADLYAAAGAFEFELFPDPRAVVKPGDRAEVYVNGELEMTGLIDKVTVGYAANGRTLGVSGRDLMGLVVDSFCEKWTTVSNADLVALAEKLLKDVPFLDRKNIAADESARRRDAKMPYVQITCGAKIFDVLKEAAASRGLMFYARADGGLCFRKPAGRGAVVMSITRRHGEPNSYIISGERSDDISGRYSVYTAVTQEQGFDSDEPPYITAKASAKDDGVPFHKPFVEAMNEDGASVKKRADMLLEQHRAGGTSVKYALKGHSQGVWNWTVDELVRVDDDELDIHENLLIYSRSFELSRGGIMTNLTLGKAGLVQ